MTSECQNDSAPERVCTVPAHCPICHAPNTCRMETGEAYKGPCWCERITLPDAAQRRLTDEIAEPRCLCPRCLEALAANPGISWSDLAKSSSPIASREATE